MPAIATAAVAAIGTFGATYLTTSAATAAALGTTVSAMATTAAATAFVTTSVAGLAASALAKKPPTPTITDPGLLETVVESDPPLRVIYGQRRVAGALTWFYTEDDGHTLYCIYTLAGHEIEEIGDVYLGDEKLTIDSQGRVTGVEGNAGKYFDSGGDFSYITIEKNLGSDSQNASAMLRAEIPSTYPSTRRGRGIANIVAKYKYKQDLFPRIPTNITAVVKGAKCYDPRTATTVYTDNPALIYRDYLTNARYGMGRASIKINDTYINTAANVCEESVALTGGGSEDRYTCNGAFDTSADPSEVMKGILACMDGYVFKAEGKHCVLAGEYRTPTLTLDESHIVSAGGYHVAKSRRSSINTIKGSYAEPLNLWQSTSFNKVTNAAYKTQDNNEEITENIEYQFVTSAATAQRLAKIFLNKSRQGTLDIVTNAHGLQVLPGDVINVTYSPLDLSSDTFEVISTKVMLAQENKTALKLRKIDSSVWSWSAEETAAVASGNSVGQDVFNVAAPTNLSLDSSEDQLLKGPSGDIISRILASWDAHPEALINPAGAIQLQIKKTSETLWGNITTINGDETSYFITSVEDGTSYDVRIRGRNNLGAVSEWTTVTSHVVQGKRSPPENVTFLHSGQNGNIVNFFWPGVSDVDLAGYELRYGPIGGLFRDATPIQDYIRATNFSTVDIKPGTWKFYIKAADTSGNFSNTAATSNLTVVNSNSLISELDDDDLTGGTYDGYTHYWTGVLIPKDQKGMMEYNETANIEDYEPFAKLCPTPVAESKYTTETLSLSFDDKVRVWGVITSELCRGHTEGAVINPSFKLAYKLSTDQSFESRASESGISTTGTYTNCFLHWSGVVNYVREADPGDYSTIEDLFDCTKNVPATASYEAPEIDLTADRNVSFGANISELLCTSSGQTTGIYSVDYRLDAGSYDGFEVWGSQAKINARYIKQKFEWRPVEGPSYLNSWDVLFDPYENWSIGEVTAQDFSGRIENDNTIAPALITSLDFVVDLEEQKERVLNQSVSASGTTVTFSDRFHNPPLITGSINTDNSYKIAFYDNNDGQTFKVKVYNDASTAVASTIAWRAVGA